MWPKNNPESWERIIEFIDRYPDDEIWSDWKIMARNIISSLEALGLQADFRIGQSMHHIIISTLERHMLHDEPRVTLDVQLREPTVRVTYSQSNIHFAEPAIEKTVDVDAALPVILSFLRLLWEETRPGTSLPAGIGATPLPEWEFLRGMK